MLSHCTTVWLQADPEDHMRRVAAQGDLRPMAASREAMEDLKRILAGRSAFYSKADWRSTPARTRWTTFVALRDQVRKEALPATAVTLKMHKNALTREKTCIIILLSSETGIPMLQPR
jgi:XRE family aerobic/anaerobic benzoate catabolism transcriptional regulator